MKLNGKPINFGPLVEFFGSYFVARLLNEFVRQYTLVSPVTTERRAAYLRKFLTALARIALDDPQGQTPIGRVQLALTQGQSQIEKADMIDAVEAVASRIRNIDDRSIINTTNPLTRKAVLDSISTTLQHLSQSGLWPNIGPVRGIRGGLAGGNIPSLGELMRPTDPAGRRAKSLTEIIELNRVRLAALRGALETRLIAAEQAFEKGQGLLARPDIPSIEKIRTALRLVKRYGHRTRSDGYIQLVLECFPLDDDDLRLASLLKYLVEDRQGTFHLMSLPMAVQDLISLHGGTVEVRGYLEGGPKALMAAYCLVMIDTGCNIQPCDDLAKDPFIAEAKRGKVRLATIGMVKNRARYKPVSGHIKEVTAGKSEQVEPTLEAPLKVAGGQISGVQAIEKWQRMSAPTRARAVARGDVLADYLWILPRGDRPEEAQRYQSPSWKGWWSSFLREIDDDPDIGGLPIQRRMIRSTVLQLRFADHGSDVEIVALLSGNTSRVANHHYLSREYIRRHLDEMIRKFQDLLEAQLSGRAPEAQRAKRLGLDQQLLADRKREAVETGLGFACVDPLAGIQSGTVEGLTCTKLEACHGCSLMRFDPTPESIVALELFRLSLEEAQDEFISRNPERWMLVWLPAFALATAATVIMADGPKRGAHAAAIKKVQAGLADGSLSRFYPW